MDSSEIKRQILMESEKTGTRDKLIKRYEGGVGMDDILAMGAAFENMVKTKGWAYIEAYIIGHANPVARLFDSSNSDLEKGKAQSLVLLLQHVDQVITARNQILATENKKREDAASNTQKTDD